MTPTQELLGNIREYIVDAQCRNGDLYHYGKTTLENLDELSQKLATVTAERDALRAQLDAVPVDALKTAFDTSMMAEWGNEEWNAQSDILYAWFKTVKI